MSDKKTSRKTVYLAIILFILGVAFLGVEPLQNAIVQKQSTETLTVTATDIEKNETKKGVYDFETVEEVSMPEVLKTQFSGEELPVTGSIAVPEVGLRLSIFKGLANENLLSGAGTMKEGQVMGQGNYALASHNMKDPSLLFAPLHRAKLGMNVYLSDAENFYVYEIKEHKIIEPTAVSVIEDTDQSLITLITCNVDGHKRLWTQGELIEIVPVEKSEEIASYFTID